MTTSTSRLVGTLALLLASPPASAQVAVIVDGPSELAAARTLTLAQEVGQLTRDDPKPIKMPKAPTHVGNFTLSGARAQLKKALADRSVKAVVGLGLLTGIAVGELSRPPNKPIILPFAAPQIQGLPKAKTRGTGVRNLAYITGLIDFDADLKRFREVIRSRKVAFIIDDYVWKTFIARKPDGVRAPDEGRDDVVTIAVPPNADGALAALTDDVKAVYLFPHFRMPFADMQRFLDTLNQRGIPSYAAGPSWVKKGAFTTLVPADLETERFRRVALYLRDALSGESLATMSTTFVRRTELMINMTTARQIGVFPSFELMTEAQLVGDGQKNKGPNLTLREAIDEGLKRNPAQQALREQRKASEAELRESRGNLLPQIALNGQFNWLDPDIASSLVNAEREISWGGSAQQIIYSPLAFNAYFAQKDIVRSVAEQVAAGRLDLVLEVIRSYLSVLQTEAVQRLNRQNLRRIRTNRALAEVRVEIGSSGPQDVARWDIELAEGRADTIQASATRNQAEIDLNRILAVPLERSFSTVDPEKGSEALLIEPRARAYVQDLFTFRIYRAFMAQEALRNSPELKQLDAQIAAQDNLIEGYLTQLYIPTLATSFGISHVLDRSGQGSEDLTGGDIPITRDNFTWQWGVNLNFTLFDDTRYGTIDRLRRGRAQLESLRLDTANRIEQGVRSALHQAGASGAAVNLRNDAVAAAHVNLEAVTSAYRQGTVTIITLIDAQNQALSAEINAANALYQYLSDFAGAERASGRFLILQSKEKRDDFFERLKTFSAEMKAEGR